jgi:hypothetical protein
MNTSGAAYLFGARMKIPFSGQKYFEVKSMRCNVGRTEQVIRISGGAVIILAGLYYKSWWGLIGIAPIITGSIRYCPLNAMLNIDTCHR